MGFEKPWGPDLGLVPHSSSCVGSAVVISVRNDRNVEGCPDTTKDAESLAQNPNENCKRRY